MGDLFKKSQITAEPEISEAAQRGYLDGTPLPFVSPISGEKASKGGSAAL
jgi:hypothetical protein